MGVQNQKKNPKPVPHALEVLDLNQSCLLDAGVSWSTAWKIKIPVVNVQSPAITSTKWHIALLLSLIRLISTQQKRSTQTRNKDKFTH